MEFVVVGFVVIAAAVTMLWWVDRRNPGRFRGREIHGEDQMESRKSWGPQ